MQQTVVKLIALLYRYCTTCFGHYNAHHQEPVKLPLQPLVSVWMCRWKCSQPTTAENTSTGTLLRKPEAATAVWQAPDDGHCNARNMLCSICTTRQYILRLLAASSWLFYPSDWRCTELQTSNLKKGLVSYIKQIAFSLYKVKRTLFRNVTPFNLVDEKEAAESILFCHEEGVNHFPSCKLVPVLSKHMDHISGFSTRRIRNC
jgi:hypothetical protein